MTLIQAQIINWHMYLYTICAELAVLIILSIAVIMIKNKKQTIEIEK